MGFRAGTFDRHQLDAVSRQFCPVRAIDSLFDLDPEELYESGKRLVLLDLDNTLVAWRSSELTQATHDWVAAGHKVGLKFCIVSNTRNRERLRELAERLGVDWELGRFKPSRRMYNAAMQRFATTPEQTLMVGDQIFTDVWGANRAGIDAIWIRQLTDQDFATTKINRLFESVLLNRLYRVLTTGETVFTPAVPAPQSFLERKVVRQFFKFCVVGLSSTIIDVGLHYLLMFVIRWNGQPLSVHLGGAILGWLPGTSAEVTPEVAKGAAYPVFKFLTAGIAILNSFYWNRRWTFGIRGHGERYKQLVKFITVAVVGMGLNVIIGSTLYNAFPFPPTTSWVLSTAISTTIVVFWNFFGQKLWTFRSRKST